MGLGVSIINEFYLSSENKKQPTAKTPQEVMEKLKKDKRFSRMMDIKARMVARGVYKKNDNI